MEKRYRIGILDFYYMGRRFFRNKVSTGTRFLKAAIKAEGHIVKVYKVEKCELYFDNRKPDIFYDNKKLRGCDILIPRLSMPSESDLDLEISFLKQFQMVGTLVLNQYLPCMRAKNKLRTLQILTNKGIPVPKTIVVRKLEYLDDGINLLGGYPVIIKSPVGNQGKGVAIVESKRSLYSALDIIWQNSNIFLIQEYVSEARGSDYRAFVIGDKVVASMQRTAPEGDFRSNLHRGGSGQKVILEESEKRLAVKATKALGLDYAGVDILRTKKGPIVMEVNANPGLEGIVEVTKIDVPKALIRYGVELLKKSKL